MDPKENAVEGEVVSVGPDEFTKFVKGLGSALQPLAESQAQSVITTQHEMTERHKVSADLEIRQAEFSDKESERKHKLQGELYRWLLAILCLSIAVAFWKGQ